MSDWGFALSAEWSTEPWIEDGKRLPAVTLFRGKGTGDRYIKLGGLLVTVVFRWKGFCRE